VGRVVERDRRQRDAVGEARRAQDLVDEALGDLVRQVRQRQRRERVPRGGPPLGRRGEGGIAHVVGKAPAALVVEAREQRVGRRRAAHRLLAERPADVRQHLADDRPPGRGHAPQVESQPPVARDQHREQRPALRDAAPDVVELGRRVHARLVGLQQPQQPVAVEVAVLGQPCVVLGDARLLARVADRDRPRPRQDRRLDRAGHQVLPRRDVVADGPLEVERVPPQDRVPDEAAGLHRRQQRLELGARAPGVVAPAHDRMETGVPVPLPWIAARARHRERVVVAAVVALAPVAVEHRPRGGGQIGCGHGQPRYPAADTG
jgi:hypothetical protein